MNDMTLVNIFLGAPEGLEEERQAFHDAVGDVNEAEGLKRGVLFVPLFVSRKLHEQAVIDSNIRSCTYYILAVDDYLGSLGRSFEYDLNLAVRYRANAELPMREVVVLLKQPAEDRSLESDVAAFRAHPVREGEPRRIEFADAPQFKTVVRDLLQGWICDLTSAPGWAS
ncbi:MAG TPA: hypothetical protein VKB88_06645 [Bryobacteraceae bacterium]|nr:hypothetical protein [Bryobacteraceae bacterium]